MTYEPENLKRWTRPESFFAMDNGWQYSSKCFVFLGRHRDSDLITESNFTCALKRLGGESDTVKVVFESHWAVGWVEWIAIHESDVTALQEADAVLDELNDYPILDESHYSELESNAVDECWRDMGMKERASYCRDADISIFTARRDYLPNDPRGALYCALSEIVNN